MTFNIDTVQGNSFTQYLQRQSQTFLPILNQLWCRKIGLTNKKEEVYGAVHVIWHQLVAELSDLELGENSRQLYQGVDIIMMSENFRRYNHLAIYAHAINRLKQDHKELSLDQKL